MEDRFARFFDSPAFGVVGASPRRNKYGNKVLRCYLQNDKRAIPVNPAQTEIEGIPCVQKVEDLPDEVKSLSVITPPQVTEKVVDAAITKGIRNIWMQPGSESAQAVQRCQEAGINVIADGSCILVVLGWREE